MDEFLHKIFSPGSTSEQWKLNKRDFLKGIAVAAFTTPVTVILQSLEAASFTFDWRMIGKVAAAGALSYLIKNFITPAIPPKA
jgi:hypothetical protein